MEAAMRTAITEFHGVNITDERFRNWWSKYWSLVSLNAPPGQVTCEYNGQQSRDEAQKCVKFMAELLSKFNVPNSSGPAK